MAMVVKLLLIHLIGLLIFLTLTLLARIGRMKPSLVYAILPNSLFLHLSLHLAQRNVLSLSY